MQEKLQYNISNKCSNSQETVYFLKKFDKKLAQLVFTNDKKYFTMKLEHTHRYNIRRII